MSYKLKFISILLTLLNILFSQRVSSYNYRRQINLMRSMAQKAYEHGIRINEDAQCSKPRAELIYLNDSKKIYLPRATLLHRCSDLTGCCPHATHSCEPSRMEKVVLHFFVISVQSSAVPRRNQNIEQLTFVNHTECACKPIDPMWNSEQLRQDNSDNPTDNVTQVRAIRDPGYPSPVLEYHPFNPSNKRISGIPPSLFSFNARLQNKDINSYKENENVLKYWANLLGYNTEKSRDNSNKKRNNKRNVTKKIPYSHVVFSPTELSYSFNTFHDNHQQMPDQIHQKQFPLINSDWNYLSKTVEQPYDVEGKDYGQMVYPMITDSLYNYGRK